MHPDQSTVTKTAMVLSEQEWEDLSVICAVFKLRFHNRPADDPDGRQRRLDLCERIMDACR